MNDINNVSAVNATMVPFVPTRDDLIGFISDGEKEIYGFRPRPDWSTLSYEQLDQWGRQLSARLTEYRKEEVRRERIAKKLRKARQAAWIAKKATYFAPVAINTLPL